MSYRPLEGMVVDMAFYGCKHHQRQNYDSIENRVFLELDISIWGCQMSNKREAIKERFMVVIFTGLFTHSEIPLVDVVVGRGSSGSFGTVWFN